MNERERNRAMDRIEELNDAIADLYQEVDEAELEEDWAELACAESSLITRRSERDELLNKFPEVRYWPKEILCRSS